ncbi:hypothetical protein Tco_0679554 [Tanacetum coccineum]|uniref:Uncharacterized protein n=1 Tax=Tanacetum coccineum TaxID=301880 RepID=A0ABQ4XJE6_9ASTR
MDTTPNDTLQLPDTVPHNLATVLHGFASVFAVPTGLPPSRTQDHSIQSCLLLHQLLPTLPSTPTLNLAEPSREPMMRRYPREPINPSIYHGWMSMSFRLRSSHYLLLIHLLLSHPDMLLGSPDPEEDPEGYEDNETEDGPVDYPINGGDDGDDDDGDSSGDDAEEDEDDEDKEDEDEEEEEHLAPGRHLLC